MWFLQIFFFFLAEASMLFRRCKSPAVGACRGGEAEGQVLTSNPAVRPCWCCSPGRCGDRELHQPWLGGQILCYLLIEYSSLNKGICIHLAWGCIFFSAFPCIHVEKMWRRTPLDSGMMNLPLATCWTGVATQMGGRWWRPWFHLPSLRAKLVVDVSPDNFTQYKPVNQ